MKKFILGALLALPLFASAQTISDFNSLGGDNYTNNWGAALTFNGGIATVGTGATADSSFDFADIADGQLTFSNGLGLQYTARVDAGNASNSFKIRFASPGGDYVYDAEVITTGWTVGQFVTGTVEVVGLPSSPVSFFTVAGDGTANAFRMSFDKLSVVPEPSTYAAIAGFVVLASVASRRRRSA